MSPELDRALCERYPKIFVDRHASRYETSMCWGFCVEDGWYDLIDILCQQLQQQVDQEALPQIVATQVKEKFGTLRFRVRTPSPTQREVIRLAEAMSERICDICGRVAIFWPKADKAAGKHCDHNAR